MDSYLDLLVQEIVQAAQPEETPVKPKKQPNPPTDELPAESHLDLLLQDIRNIADSSSDP
ncbi:hypothetical protein HNI00_21685 [Thermoleptolyngbya oregonensis NK1-22]|jgi:hypothetical protein|uniref:Uncharacterized protein n=1 Tax=Thermoleptolyngbya oregonensis NK1-22 TaxID=2547457 RepID=A0AA96Y797_9CYAN|nr:hypothetical protein [Thermoleptolyngbya sp. M55_K2018_002]WOB45450.1 hypothetical protein HNI00_21685 [Thermoleptolyngbya oregonensis NK1-22]HIK39608.1 hypothetical protein [Thermoleptolyngbya sp. M55_K2018_002]